jgi:hypothetical protein
MKISLLVGILLLFAANTYSVAAQPVTPPDTTLPGDANGDGKVNGVDYVIWLNNYGQTIAGQHRKGDFNESGKVDGTDYVVWLNNYRV